MRDRRTIRAPKRYVDYLIQGINKILITDGESKIYKKTLESHDAEKWKGAMLNEIRSQIENQTLTLVDPPRKTKIFLNKWVFKIKKNKGDSTLQDAFSCQRI